MFKVYVSSSMQENNVGVGTYETEKERMFQLADKVAELLKANGNFEVYRNKNEWTLKQLVNDVNSKCDRKALFIDNHSNAGEASAQGTEVYYYGQGGKNSNSYKIARLLYNKIAPLSIGNDRGILPDTSLYSSGLYVVQKTTPPACLIEHIFHTNIDEVNNFLSCIDNFAQAEYEAICQYFAVPVTLPVASFTTANDAIDYLAKMGRISSPDMWKQECANGVLNYIEIIFTKWANDILTR